MTSNADRIAIRLLGAALALVSLGVFMIGCASETNVLLVRHAEVGGSGSDPDLSQAGRERAEALVMLSRREKVGAVVVTPLKRTQQTAAPTAREFGLTPVVVPLTGGATAHASAVAEAVRVEIEKDPTRGVLVVGHSNTVPLIVKALGVEARPIGDDEFARVFVVTMKDGKVVRVKEEKYGE